MNAYDRIVPATDALPPIGVLPLGTGNAWAHVTGARKLAWCVDRLRASTDGPLPTRRFGLIEVEGVLTHFAGSGWDSQILEDFRAQLEAAKGPSRRLAKSVGGYLSAMLLRTVDDEVRGRLIRGGDLRPDSGVAGLELALFQPGVVAPDRLVEERFAGMVEASRNRVPGIEADLRFHRGILAAGRNPLLLQMGNLIGVGLFISHRFSHEAFIIFLPQHRDVMEAIKAGDAEGARRAMHRLLGDTMACLKDHIHDD